MFCFAALLRVFSFFLTNSFFFYSLTTGHPTRREVAQEILNASIPTGLTQASHVTRKYPSCGRRKFQSNIVLFYTSACVFTCTARMSCLRQSMLKVSSLTLCFSRSLTSRREFGMCLSQIFLEVLFFATRQVETQRKVMWPLCENQFCFFLARATDFRSHSCTSDFRVVARWNETHKTSSRVKRNKV